MVKPLLGTCLLTLLAACPSSKGPAQAIQPTQPTIADADKSTAPPKVEACATPARHDLMAVDWTPELRGDLEVAMKEGVALVHYDCKTLTLEPACTLEGSYGFIGTTRREKQIEMNTNDEVAANLPISGISWLTEVGGKLDRERGMLAKLVSIGKRSSAKKVAQRAELAGSCDGATHFVRAATIGAFAVATGSRAELGATLTIMGKGASGTSESATKIASQDGDLAACGTATPDAKAPPDQCGALVRIELEPIGGTAPAITEPGTIVDVPVTACAPGFAFADGACRRPDVPHECAPSAPGDCAKQCDAGNATSCATLAVAYRNGTGVAKDWAKASELATKACDGESTLGCRVAGLAKVGGEGTKQDADGGLALLAKACSAGDGAACVDLGTAQLGSKQLADQAQYSFRRACYGGGEFEGCAYLGILYADGKGGVSKSGKLAASFFEKGCKEGSLRACTGLAKLLSAGTGVPKNKERAKALYEQACNGGFQPACGKK